jgi:asparagine synthase (glutamine-hydrolysing)
MLGDRMEMGHSIEGRVPFLDHKVVEVITRHPVNQKIRGMTEKYVLREAVKDVITDTVYKRQKHPFLSPPATLNTNGELHTFMQDTLRGGAMRDLPFFDQRSVVAFLDRLPDLDTETRTASDPLLTYMTSLCVLQERFGLSGSAVRERQELAASII